MVQHEPLQQEPRYDAETLRKVTALASELQARDQERLTAREIEEIGSEVGLEPQFIRQALRQVTPQKREVDPLLSRHWLRTLRKAWWACGWALPLMLLMSMPRTDVAAGIFFSSWGIYAAVGIILGSLAKSPDEIVQDDHRERRRGRSRNREEQGATVSRAELLNVLGGIRVAVEVRKPEQHGVAALCLEALLEGEIPRHTSNRFDRWSREVVERNGGELRPEDGLLATALFRDEASAVRAAGELAAGDAPFDVRIGVAATAKGGGEEARQRARAVCRRADPGDILLTQELADEAVLELNGVAALPDRMEGERVFSWRAAHGHR